MAILTSVQVEIEKMHKNTALIDSRTPNWCSFEATDPDEQAHNLREWQQQYDQTSNGVFYGRIDEIRTNSVQVFREHTSQALYQQCNVHPDSVWLGFASGHQGCRINGEEVTATELMYRPGGTEFELITPQNFDIYGIVIEQTKLEQCADAQGILLDQRLLTAPRQRVNERQLNTLQHALQQLLPPRNNDFSESLVQDILLMLVLDTLQQSTVEQTTRMSHARRQAVVEQVKDYLNAHASEVITMTELCALTHVSRRTLQYSFESIMGISPLRYLRLSRLNAVRRALSDPTSVIDTEIDHATVQRIASYWGFWHPGQFAHDYKQLFGENPSETLSRGLQF